MTGPLQSTEDGQDQSIVTICALASDGESVESIEVVAYPTPTPGLVVHRSLWETSGWTVTHAATGTGVSQWSWPSRQAAALLAQRLGPLADWTADEPRLDAAAGRKGEEWGGRIRQTADRLADELGLTVRSDHPHHFVDELWDAGFEDLDDSELVRLADDVRAILDQLVGLAIARGLW